MNTVFILDDTRNIRQAMREISWPPELHGDITYAVAKSVEDGFDIVQESAPFDLWVLDHDLGDSTGLWFLKRALGELHVGTQKALCRDKAPKYLRCCSGNFHGRSAIESYWEDFMQTR
jgi:hypothetical protein